MAYAIEHRLFQFHGLLPSSEQWSLGLRSSGASAAITDALLTTFTQKAADRFRTYAVALQALGYWSAGTTFAGVTGRVISTAGLTTKLAERAPATALPVGTSAQYLPNQTSLVVSLTTATATRRGKGRVYLPLLGLVALDANGRLTNVAAVLAASKTWIDGMHTDWKAAAAGPVWERVSVMSRVGAGATNLVTSIRIGDALDTQQRRRSAIVELYTAATLV